MLEITNKSHLDHGLTLGQIAHIKALFADRDGFFIESFELPEGLGTVPCTLRGPAMGDEPVSETEVTYKVRGDRPYPSRIHSWPARRTRTVTVIAGPYGQHKCLLYTAFGGPSTPQEPGELEKQLEVLMQLREGVVEGPKPSDDDIAKMQEKLRFSKEFWAHHALGE